MKSLVVMLSILASALNGIAGYRVYCGGNFSTFNTNASKIGFEGVFGIDKIWNGEQSSWSLGVQYVVRSANTTENMMLFNMTDQGYSFDALFSVGYLEVPLMTLLHFSRSNKIKFALSMGPSLAIALFDNSKRYNSVHFDFEQDSNYRNKIRDYYKEAVDPGRFWLQSNAGFFLNSGLVAEYQNICIELRYSHGLNQLGVLNGLDMKGEKYRTLEIVFGIYLGGGE